MQRAVDWSLERVLAQPSLSRALVPAGSADWVRALSRALPDVAVAGGFEIPLAPESRAYADYSLWLTAHGGSRERLAGLEEAREPVLQHREWLALREFAREWLRPGSPLAKFVPFAILEFDSSRASDSCPVPSAFACIEPMPLWHARSLLN